MKPKTLRRFKIFAGLVVAALVLHTALLVTSGLALRNAREELRAAELLREVVLERQAMKR